MLVADLQLAITVVVLVIKEGAYVDLGEKITLGVGLPIVVIWVILGWLVVSR